MSDRLKIMLQRQGFTSEKEVVDSIMQSPYERLSKESYNKICGSRYTPGTFFISERMQYQNFLFDEKNQPFCQWFQQAIIGEIRRLSRNKEFLNKLEEYGEKDLISDSYRILFFNTMLNKKFSEIIPNQEYSDVFRRIVLFLLYGDANHEIQSYQEFNTLGYHLVPKVLERGKYTLKQRLCQSIYSGLIGMDIKDELAATSPLSREKIIPLKTRDSNDEKIDRIFNCLNEVAQNGKLAIDSWSSFEANVVNAKTVVTISWFTDDYIPTMFEMKFIEELLLFNPKIYLTLIPRVQSYSNDATYSDVENILQLPIFKYLKELKEKQRFKVCHHGMDMGTFDGTRLSKQCASELESSDYIVISGARSYEMGQGLNKHCFFSGVAICRNYSETVTGVCKDDGAIMFLEQKPGEKTFWGFRERATQRKYCSIHKRWYPVAAVTALDCMQKRKVQ